MPFESLDLSILQQVIPAVLLRSQPLFPYQLPHSHRSYTEDLSGLFRRDQAHLSKCSKPQCKINQLQSAPSPPERVAMVIVEKVATLL